MIIQLWTTNRYSGEKMDNALKIFKKKYIKYLLVTCGIIAGILFIYYAFELVSVPAIIEYHEWVYVFIGVCLIAAGTVFGLLYKTKND